LTVSGELSERSPIHQYEKRRCPGYSAEKVKKALKHLEKWLRQQVSRQTILNELYLARCVETFRKYQAGASVRELAEQEDVSERSVRLRLHKASDHLGEPLRKPDYPGSRPDPTLVPRNLEIVARYRAGAEARDIAKDFGISRPRVYQILRKADPS
jgi:DNA-binding CsgD family transcriptional regulator